MGKKRLLRELVKRIEDLEDWENAACADIDDLYNVVDPWGKREGSVGWVYRRSEDPSPLQDIEVDAVVPEKNYTLEEALAFCEGYDYALDQQELEVEAEPTPSDTPSPIARAARFFRRFG